MNQFGHDIDFYFATVEHKARVYHKGLSPKAWYSNRDRRAANDHSDTGDLKQGVSRDRLYGAAVHLVSSSLLA